jgi:CRISPR system Cascade subunit CasE
MFLSRARLRPGSAVRALAPLLLPEGDARLLAAHRLVWSLMSDDAGRTRDFLWREERPGAFLILAPRPAIDAASLFEVDCKEWAPALREGDRLGFALRANATVARPDAARRDRRRDVVMDALFDIPQAQRAARRPEVIVSAGTAWLQAQGARAGFTLLSTRVDGYDVLKVERRGPKPLEIATLEFEGQLIVGDPAIFVAAVTAGFGRARAFGRGLMLLRRVPGG